MVSLIIKLSSHWRRVSRRDAFLSVIGCSSGSKWSSLLTLTSTSAAKWRRWQQSCRPASPVLYYLPKNGAEWCRKGGSDLWTTVSLCCLRYPLCCIVFWLTAKRWFYWTTSTSETPIQSSSAVWQVSKKYCSSSINALYFTVIPPLVLLTGLLLGNMPLETLGLEPDCRP